MNIEKMMHNTTYFVTSAAFRVEVVVTVGLFAEFHARNADQHAAVPDHLVPARLGVVPGRARMNQWRLNQSIRNKSIGPWPVEDGLAR